NGPKNRFSRCMSFLEAEYESFLRFASEMIPDRLRRLDLALFRLKGQENSARSHQRQAKFLRLLERRQRPLDDDVEALPRLRRRFGAHPLHDELQAQLRRGPFQEFGPSLAGLKQSHLELRPRRL